MNTNIYFEGTDICMMQHTYGHFIPDTHDFLITAADIPRNWYNYLWNDNYITFVSQTGAGCGFAQDSMGRRLELVNERCLFLVEGDDHWGISGLPVEEHRDRFSCLHKPGSTTIHTENRGIATEVCFFVPGEENAEVWQVKIRNSSAAPRAVKLMGYAGTKLDGAYVRQGYNTGVADYDPQLQGILFHSWSKFGDGNFHPFCGYMAMTQPADEYSCAANSFIGTYGSFAYPKAVAQGKLSCSRCVNEKLGFALGKHLTLQPGEEAEFSFLCGIASSPEDALALRQQLSQKGAVQQALDAVTEKYTGQIDAVSIQTPDEELNHMFSWLKHQANMGSRWARVRHNGYRDMTSDSECLSCIDPHLALERFQRILTYQYANGYAPRTFLDGMIKDNKFADNTVWITFAAMSILKELGDNSILDIPVAFNDGTEASIYQHIKRSVEFLYNFRGLHGLIRIWGGDWNDGMNTAGLEGKGVSVWLSLAWLRANKMFAQIAELTGNQADAELAHSRTREMQQIIEDHGWDGEYYLCAYNDWDEKIGSVECDEGKLFLIPQIWSVFSGVSDCGREVIAMDAVEDKLASPAGIVISRPAYTTFDPHIGVVTRKPAGIHENGGVYLHTIAWKIAADAMLKRPDKVEAGINTFLPFRNPIVAGRAEPYMACNSYCGMETGDYAGLPGQSWRSASGSWFVKALVTYVFGLVPEMEGLRIDPCLPPSWKTCSIQKQFRGAEYTVSYENGGTQIRQILVNGEPIHGTVLPWKPGAKYTVQVFLTDVEKS